MFMKFIALQWKSFFRSAHLGKSLGIKILMGFFAVYILLCLLGAGVGMYFVLAKVFPDQSPIWSISHYLIYWMLIELLVRYFLQKIPVLDVKPLLTTPTKKSTLTHYILCRALANVYNLFAVFFFVPFAIVLVLNGHAGIHVLSWLVAMLAIGLVLNYTNLLINKNNKALVFIASILVVGYALEYMELVTIKAICAPIFHALYAYPISALVPIAIAVGMYLLNYQYLKTQLYLDARLKDQTRSVSTSDLAWANKFGEMGPFLQLDLKLIWRNKRTKNQFFMSLIFVFYGLIFYTQDMYADVILLKVGLGVFMTGIFLSNFGQFIPAWDSSYYSMMMSQNIPLRKYLDAKALLISVSVVVMFVLTIPYVYFGWEVLAINFASALYNLGVNVPVILFFGSYNKKRIELDVSPFGNMQGASATQFLLVLPIILAPVGVFALFYYTISVEAALVALSVLGIIGYSLKNYVMTYITAQYRKKKYAMIAGFKEKAS